METGSMGGLVRAWMQDRFAKAPRVSRQELVDASERSELPEEARAAVALLPDGSWPPEEALHEIVDVLETRAGGGARGNGNLAGKGGYGRSR